MMSAKSSVGASLGFPGGLEGDDGAGNGVKGCGWDLRSFSVGGMRIERMVNEAIDAIEHQAMEVHSEIGLLVFARIRLSMTAWR